MDSTNQKEKLSINPILIENELKNSFLDYAMSVIVARAIPDVRDGLKPVHRRILYTMNQLGFHHNKPYHKSVRVVGEVLGRYHPHGDQAVYQTMVGMVQEFTKRAPLLDGQGNWGSIDGDNAAAYRYTEVRMAKIAQEILADLDKETVEFVPNFDESTVEPVILPSRLPNFIINGTSGIAVGMATSVPPHNLGEVIDGCLALLDNENLEEEELFKLIPAPDFPTGGIIRGRGSIIKAYNTGRGNLILRAVVNTEETQKGQAIVITELPYQVNKAEFIIKVADLVKNKIIEGISNIRDESDKHGIRVVIELKRDAQDQLVLNLLYKHTALQTSVGILMLALLDNKPIVFSLRQLLKEFLTHREIVITKRTQFDLNKALAREHILLGFTIVLDNVTPIVELIKNSQDADEAILLLGQKYSLSEMQSKAILEMRLQRLTGLEKEKIYNELEEVKITITNLKAILANKDLLKKEIIKELEEIKENYADPRRTKIEGPIDEFSEADLVAEENVVVTLTKKGYIKRVPLAEYTVQHRGGKGKMAMAALEDDILQDICVANTHDELLFFTNLGRIYNLTAYYIPEGSRTSKGRAIINLLPLTEGEKVVKILFTKELENKFVVMLSKLGVIKRTEAILFSKIRSTGIRAITLNEGDELVFCALSNGESTIVIATALGQGIRFKETEVRSMGRMAAGVRGIRLKKNDFVVGMEVLPDNTKGLIFASEYGFGKRVSVEDFRVAHRGGMGVKTIPVNKRNGEVIGLALVDDKTDVLLIDEHGKIIRLSSSEIRTMGRQAQGVRLIRLEEGRKLFALATITEEETLENGLPESISKTELEQDIIKEIIDDKIETQDESDESDSEL